MIDCNNVCIKISPLMVPAATVSLHISSRRTKAIPANANGKRRDM